MRWTLATILLAIPTLATAQDAIALKMPPQAKGDVRRVVYDTDQTVRLQRLDMFGTEIKERASRVASQLTYVDECLDADNGEIKRYRRRFENATETVNDANPTILAIHGKTLVVDHRSGPPQIIWQDGKPLSDGITGPVEDAIKEGKDKLGGIASFEPLPDRPVKVGESWNIDVSAIVKDCEAKHGCKLTGATGIGTLKEVYQGAKGRCAKVEVHIRVPICTIKSGERQMALTDGSGTTLDAYYDFALDGSDSHYSSKIRMAFLATGRNPEADGTSTRVRMELGIDLKEERSTGP
jgi:hypothetical protein